LSLIEEYKSWAVAQGEHLPLFLRPWWLDAVCLPDQWQVALARNKENKIIGVLPFYKFYKKGIPVIGLPFLTPYLGIYLEYPSKQKLNSRYDFEKEVLDKLIQQIPRAPYLQQKFFPSLTYGLPFYWQGFRLDWRYTYHLSLQQDEKTIWENMEGSARTQLQKTMKQVEIVESQDTRAMYYLVGMTFSRQGKKMPYSMVEFDRLHQAATAHNKGKIYLAVLKENQTPVAGMFLAHDTDTVYNLVLGRNHLLDPGGSIHGILWTAIQHHIGKQQIFDFEGSMLEGPERMFRSFGSIRVPVLQVTRYQNRWWKAALALVGR
jgi:hypothetical protein